MAQNNRRKQNSKMGNPLRSRSVTSQENHKTTIHQANQIKRVMKNGTNRIPNQKRVKKNRKRTIQTLQQRRSIQRRVLRILQKERIHKRTNRTIMGPHNSQKRNSKMGSTTRSRPTPTKENHKQTLHRTN